MPLQKRAIAKPDDQRIFMHGTLATLNLGGVSWSLATFQPGWRWSDHVKPIVHTDLCEVPHLLFQIAGTMQIVMANGDKLEIGPGDVAEIPPGHDAWTTSDVDAVALDVSPVTAESYARRT